MSITRSMNIESVRVGAGGAGNCVPAFTNISSGKSCAFLSSFPDAFTHSYRRQSGIHSFCLGNRPMKLIGNGICMILSKALIISVNADALSTC